MGKRDQKYTTTLGNAIEDAIAELEQFASDVRDSADRMEETFPSAERTERYQIAADELEGISTDPEVPATLVDVRVTYLEDTRTNPSKRTQLANLVNVWEAIYEAAQDASADTEDDDLQAYVESLGEVFETLQGVEL